MRVYTTQLSGITTHCNIALKLTHSPLSYAFLLQGQLANRTMALQRFDEARQILKEPQMLKAPQIRAAIKFGEGLQVGLKAKTRYL